jgi:hypothetical protein
MGMAVFAGMSVATILGVCLIPMLFVMVEKITGGKSGHAAPSSPPPEAAAGHAQGGH